MEDSVKSNNLFELTEEEIGIKTTSIEYEHEPHPLSHATSSKSEEIQNEDLSYLLDSDHESLWSKSSGAGGSSDSESSTEVEEESKSESEESESSESEESVVAPVHTQSGPRVRFSLQEVEKLDKKELAKNLIMEIPLIRRSKLRNHLLNRKMRLYYRKAKVKRAFTRVDPKHNEDLKRRYESCLRQYERSLIGEREMKEQWDRELKRIQEKEKVLEEEIKARVENYERRQYELGIALLSSRTGLPLSDRAVRGLINRQRRAREAMSKNRLACTRNRQRAEEIKAKLKAMDNLGNGLQMADYERLYNDVESVLHKIDEQNNELSRLRLRCNTGTQRMAHVNEKKNVVFRAFLEQQGFVECEIEEREAIREEVNRLKKQKEELKKVYDEMTENSGILNRPELLLDYDVIAKKLAVLKARKAHLIKENEELEAKISALTEDSTGTPSEDISFNLK